MINMEDKEKRRHKIVLGGFQTPNTNNDRKRSEIMDILWTIDHKYNHPKCIYMDFNCDMEEEWASKIITSIRIEGWKVWINNSWTRKGYTGQKNSNIDIILYKGFQKEGIKVTPWEYDGNLSDHKAIQVDIKVEGIDKDYLGN